MAGRGSGPRLRRGPRSRARRARGARRRLDDARRGRRCRRPGPAHGAPAAADPGEGQLGYVRVGEGSYSLTPRVLRLGMAYVGAQGLWDVARPHLEDLVSRTGESSSMAQLDGSDIVYVARVSVPKIIALRVEIGTRFPAAQTSQGKVLLAALPPEEVAPTVALPSQSGLPPYIGRSTEQLLEELAQVRARGWALANEELAPGVRSVAVPVRDGTGAVRAAMNVTVHAAATSVDTLLDDHLPHLLRGRRGQRRLDVVAEPPARRGARGARQTGRMEYTRPRNLWPEGQPSRPGLHELRLARRRRARLVARRRRRRADLPSGRRPRHHVLGHRQRLQRQRVRGDHRSRDREVQPSRGRRARDEGVLQDARRARRVRPLAQGDHGADRRLAAAARHRLRRPLPDPPFRPGHPGRG